MGVSLVAQFRHRLPVLNYSSPTYDTDNNFLQAVDDVQTQAIIPRMLARRSIDSPLKILDFGCGTGRTTVTLLQHCPAGAHIEAWDASAEMLAIARHKCAPQVQSGVSINFQQVDFSTVHSLPRGQTFDMIVSTLVLEHLDSSTFFTSIADLLSPGSIAFVTNMHPDMGTTSVAGFEDESQQRVIGKSYLHGVQESAVAARKAGLQVENQDVIEVAVTAEMIDRGEVPERGRKWVGKKVWFGLVGTK